MPEDVNTSATYKWRAFDSVGRWVSKADHRVTIGRPFLCRDAVLGLRLAVFETGYGTTDLHSRQQLRDVIEVYEFPLDNPF